MKNKYKITNDIYNSNHKWINKNEFQEILSYLREKEEKYISEVINSLNNIHNQKKSDFFWRKSLGLGFRRFVHITYDAYSFHKNFNPSTCDFKVVDKREYITPLNFEEFRDTFTNDEIGDKQLFSQYIECFYDYNSNVYEVPSKINQESEMLNSKSKISTILKRKIKNVTIDKIINKLSLLLFQNKNPQLLILNSYFKPSYLKTLLYRSYGKIKIMNSPNTIQENSFEVSSRKEFVRNFKNIDDDFDKFFYNTIYYNFPSIFIENFNSNYIHYNNYLSQFESVKYIVCENWISSTSSSLLLAIAKENMNVKHIYNEHNALFHHLLGNSVNLQKDLSDIYYTVGWNDDSGVVKGASLYDFNHTENYKKTHDILFVSSNTFIKRSEWNAHYSFAQDAAQLQIKFSYDFFYNLSLQTLNKITYRAYNTPSKWRVFNKEEILSKFKLEMSCIDDFKFSSKVMMKKSRLVIIDYISTGYLESLIMNIPTIVFWNQNSYFLNNNHLDFFEDLVACGICQTSPEGAADFVNELTEKESIEYWWNSERTQSARKAFLDKNIGNPGDAINFYLELV